MNRIHFLSIILSLLTFCQANLSPECSNYQCALRRDQRIDCSPKENSRDRCLSLGCCFDNSVYDTIWCFHPLSLPQGRCPHPECQVLPEDREACFGANIYTTAATCNTYGCCYDEDTYGAPLCFRRKVQLIAYTGFASFGNYNNLMNCYTVNPFGRRPCGGRYTTQSQCTRFRCCWVEIKLAGPQCFHPEPFRGQRLLF